VIGLDTNVLVRFLTHDDAVQTPVAVQLVNSLTSDSPGFVSLVVLAELNWVLKALYSVEKSELELILENLLLNEALVVESSEIVWEALRKSKATAGGFTDCLIECSCNAAECLYTVTFDRKAATAGMRLLH
jgi:predicted nucleic-acid-binding protein